MVEIAVVLDHQLPVALKLEAHGVLGAAKNREVVAVEFTHDRSDEFFKCSGPAIQVDKDPVVPSLAADLEQPGLFGTAVAACLVHLRTVIVGPAVECSIQAVRPCVIGAGQDGLAVQFVGDEARAPMRTDIVEHADGVVTGTSQEHRTPGHSDRKHVPGFRYEAGRRRKGPSPREQPRTLEFMKRRICERRVRQSPGLCRVEVQPGEHVVRDRCPRAGFLMVQTSKNHDPDLLT